MPSLIELLFASMIFVMLSSLDEGESCWLGRATLAIAALPAGRWNGN